MTLEELLLASENLSEADKLKLVQSLGENISEPEEIEVEISDEMQEKQPENNSIDHTSKSQANEINQPLSQSFNTGEFELQDSLKNTRFSNIDIPVDKKLQPSLVGFHTHALITTVVLDCVWMVLEVGTGGLINIIVFVIFGITSYVVFTKQRLLGDSQSIALTKAVFLGIVAGLPFSFTGLFIFGLFGFLNKVLPATENFAVKLPTVETYDLGSFMSEFRQLETLLSQSVAAIDPKSVNKEISKNIAFVEEKGLISEELLALLDETRRIRNNLVHGSATMPPKIFTKNDLQILKQCKIAAEKALKR
jgi:hypothetical protein